jgi:nitroimidazol reductase NimA-like FMN-containing flavoprotein (pyridoxamine 5'-phosphate oxidase superfamily)
VALICHLGVVRDGTPLVLPTGFGRDGDTLYLHGSTGASSLMIAGTGTEVCVTVTLLDGIVYARSINNHSMNYRSAVVLGTARPVLEADAKLHALRVITDHLAPGSWEHARDVNARSSPRCRCSRWIWRRLPSRSARRVRETSRKTLRQTNPGPGCCRSAPFSASRNLRQPD